MDSADDHKPCKAGEACDLKGYPIHPGDLLRTFHFKGRRRNYWLYHVAVEGPNGIIEMVPTSELEPKRRGRGGRFWLTKKWGREYEILSGHGPGSILDHYDRPKSKGGA